MTDYSQETLRKVYTYLDKIYGETAISMLDASPLIENAFGIDWQDATELLSHWIEIRFSNITAFDVGFSDGWRSDPQQYHKLEHCGDEDYEKGYKSGVDRWLEGPGV